MLPPACDSDDPPHFSDDDGALADNKRHSAANAALSLMRRTHSVLSC